jgi:hypothetical protein
MITVEFWWEFLFFQWAEKYSNPCLGKTYKCDIRVFSVWSVFQLFDFWGSSGFVFLTFWFRTSSGLPFGLLGPPIWLPFGSLLAPFGSLLAPFGSLLAPFGSFWFPLGSLWLPFGSLWRSSGSIWLPSGSLLASFGSLLVPFGFLGLPLALFWQCSDYVMRRRSDTSCTP